MTLRARLALGFIAIAIVLLMPLAIAMQALSELGATTRALQDRDVAASLRLSQVRSHLEELTNAEKAVLFADDTGAVSWLNRELDALSSQSDSLRQAELGPAAELLDSMLNVVRREAPREIAAVEANDIATADSISLNLIVPALRTADAAVTRGEREIARRTSQSVIESAARARDARETAMLAFALATVFAALIAVAITRSISRPVRDLELGMRAVAGGDFGHTLRFGPDRRDEFGRLSRSYASMALQLKQLDQMKAEFVSVASHELKTPINVMVGYLQLMDEGVYGPVTPRQREVLATLGTQAEALARLAQQLLDVSRFEAGGGKLELSRFSPTAVLRELEGTFQVWSMQRNIRFEVDLSSDLPDTVLWDADRMKEVVGNLLSNAFKFTPAGGRVGLGAEPSNGQILLEVSDSGAGIPASQLSHVFKKFYQADNQGAAAIKGTGLGLAIAREIVEAHGGDIMVESTPGVGTVFTILIPVEATSPAPGQRTPDASVAAAART
jgi:signal transduction histidine kinase